MKIINLKEFSPGKIHPQYMGVCQPMKIYHSTKELMENEDQPRIASNIFEFQLLLSKCGIDEKNHCKYLNLEAFNIWINTGEKAVPDYFTEDDQVVYKLDDGKIILTDAVYIKLFVIYSTPSRHICLTSSGMFKINISEWNLSGAIKPQYSRISTTNRIKYTSYNARLEKILHSQKSSIQDIRLFYFMFNPLSETFLNADKSVQKVYGSYIRKSDREKIINSDKFKKIMLRELGKFMPDLRKELQKIITPEIYGNLLLDGLKLTIQDKSTSVSDKLEYLREVREQVFDIGGTDEGLLLPAHQNPHQLLNGNKAKALPNIQFDKDSMPNNSTDKLSLSPFTDKEYEDLREEVGGLDNVNELENFDEEFLSIK